MSFREHAPILGIDNRIKSFDEIKLGYDLERARLEAMRCARCQVARAPCGTFGCPIGTRISAITRRIREGKLDEAAELLAESNPLCSITSRVCQSEEQCEKFCALNGLPVLFKQNKEDEKGEPVAISSLERLVGDRWLEEGMEIKKRPSTGKKVAVIGSGPAGSHDGFRVNKERPRSQSVRIKKDSGWHANLWDTPLQATQAHSFEKYREVQANGHNDQNKFSC